MMSLFAEDLDKKQASSKVGVSSDLLESKKSAVTDPSVASVLEELVASNSNFHHSSYGKNPSSLMPSVARNKSKSGKYGSSDRGLKFKRWFVYLRPSNLTQLRDLEGLSSGIKRKKIDIESLNRTDPYGFGFWDTGDRTAVGKEMKEELPEAKKVKNVLTDLDYEALMTKCGFRSNSSVSDGRAGDGDDDEGFQLSNDDLIEIEKHFVNLANSSICLNPSGLVSCVHNLINYRDRYVMSNEDSAENLDLSVLLKE